MERHQKSGLAVARFLTSHTNVVSVDHPLLETSPSKDLAMKQVTKTRT